MSRYANRQFWIVVFVLVIAVFSRFTRLNELPLNPDEIWSVWQTLGTPTEILRWTPYDWPPLYYLVLGAWHSNTSMLPPVLRLLSVLVFLPGMAFMFRVMRRWYTTEAAALAALVYAALGYSILLSIEVRGYALLMALGPLALWLTERYFTKPSWRRALPLALSLAAMYYVSLTSIGIIVMLGLFTLVVHRRQVWRWWLPGMAAGLLALPEIISKASIAVARIEATRTLAPLPLPEALIDVFWNWTGSGVVVWAALFLLATGMLLMRRLFVRRPVQGLLMWVLVIPVLLYLTNPLLGFFSARYAWWVIIGLALWIGWGLSLLPRYGLYGAGTALVVLAFVPLPAERYVIFDNPSPLDANYKWLQTHMQTGDVFVLDPSSACGGPEEWDYYTRAYFPNGLQFVQRPDGYRRVWHILYDLRADTDIQTALDTSFVHLGVFVGPPGCLFRLYEAPPDADGLLFDNGMRFHGVDVIHNGLPRQWPSAWHEGETIHLRLWWSADRPIDRDYSVGTYVVLEGSGAIAEVNGPPQVIYPAGGPVETSRWQPGTFYVEERELTLPYPLWRVSLTAALAVYYWEDPVRVDAPGLGDDRLLRLFPVYVMAY